MQELCFYNSLTKFLEEIMRNNVGTISYLYKVLLLMEIVMETLFVCPCQALIYTHAYIKRAVGARMGSSPPCKSYVWDIFCRKLGVKIRPENS